MITVNAEKSYPGFKLKVEETFEGVTIIKGENGKGKSTLLKMIMGYIRYKGNIKGKARVLSTQDLPDRFTSKDIRYIYGVNDSFHRYKYLSKGMKQKLKLRIYFKFDSILLDEPMDGLDIENCEWFIKRLKDYNGVAIVVTHRNITGFNEYRM